MKRFSVLSLILFGLSLATWPQAQAQISPSDPAKPGQYAVGHTGYLLTDANNGNRPVYFMVWYPVDPSSIGPSTPTAQYPFDPYTGSTYLPIMLSTDFEAVGYDAAYETVPPSHGRPFPLVVFSPAHTIDSWQYLNVAPRLATHGYVVAVAEHWNDCQFPWGGCDEFITAAINRPRDMSFIITQLLDKNRTPGELLFETINPEKIAAGGHSFGVYTTYALAGGDRLVCDALGPVLFAGESLPYPSGTCVKTLPDRRVKAVVALDGISSQWLHWDELRKISVPSLIMGETYDAMTTNYPGLGDWNARPHAAIDRFDSYRVDVNGTNHGSFLVMCDALQIWYNYGLIPWDYVEYEENSPDCALTISPADTRLVVTKYMIAFLDIYFRSPDANPFVDRWILTEEYALHHTPQVQFFASEKCEATTPDNTYYSYRPYQISTECNVDQKDPTGWFTLKTPPSNSDLLLKPGTDIRLMRPKLR